MNSNDMNQRNIAPEQMVDITSTYGEIPRTIKGWFAIPYPVRKGCVASYFPETNVLIPVNHTCKACETPAFKSVSVQVQISS
jgi:anaerobic selenocysteine-containing dehydrogenase